MNMSPNDMNNQMQEIAKRYTDLPYLKRLRNMMDGLGSPRSSRTYKESMIELQRLSAPAVAVLLPLLMVGMLVVLSASKKVEDRVITSFIVDQPPLIDLVDDIKPNDKPVEREKELKVEVPIDQPNIENLDPVEQPLSPQPQPPINYIPIKSPTIFKNLPYPPGRGTDERPGLIEKGGGDTNTEAAVEHALRWLKKNQQPNGSWRTQSIAMTGLAVLTFLSHDEIPGKSKEFGETVQKGLEYLMSQQLENGHFKGSDGHEYSLPIATYALCEAYGMTMNPNVKRAAEKALSAIVNGQQASGGWDYNVKQTVRADTSYMGWCAQAVKAGYMARLDVAGLDKSIKLAVRGFKRNASAEGGFGYTAPSGNHGMTSVGTLCMQLLGGADQQEVKRSMAVMDKWTPSFDEKALAIGGQSLQYYFYYATQCRFHEGGTRWKTWNATMKSVYLPAQKKLSKELSGYVDHLGKPQEIGWWENQDHHTDRPVMDTCLAALQLMVYYRYLPTTRVAAITVIDDIHVTTVDKDDIVVNTPNI